MRRVPDGNGTPPPAARANTGRGTVALELPLQCTHELVASVRVDGDDGRDMRDRLMEARGRVPRVHVAVV